MSKKERFFPRLNFDISASFIFKSDSKDKLFPVEIRNISEGGVLVTSPIKLKTFENLPLEISFSQGAVATTKKVKIKWIKDFDQNNFLYGLKFLEDLGSFRDFIRKSSFEQNKGYFIYETTAYLKDINLYGTVYFSRFFEWQGAAREEFLMLAKDYKEILSSGIYLITKSAWMDYVNHAGVFDRVLLKLQVTNIKHCCYDVIFTFFDTTTDQLLGTGGQTIVFTDQKGAFIKIPLSILNGIKLFKVS